MISLSPFSIDPTFQTPVLYKQVMSHFFRCIYINPCPAFQKDDHDHSHDHKGEAKAHEHGHEHQKEGTNLKVDFLNVVLLHYSLLSIILTSSCYCRFRLLFLVCHDDRK